MTWKTIRQYAFIILLGVGLSFFIQQVAYAQVIVQQHSMQYTYEPGDRLLENKWIYYVNSPEKGDVVILREPGSDRRLIKRVVATAGDTIDMRNGQLIINDQPLTESYARGRTESKGIELPLTIAEGEVFVIGDNREVSIDSRSFGAIPEESIEGKIIAKVWPLF